MDIEMRNLGSLALNQKAASEKRVKDSHNRFLNLVDGKIRIVSVSTEKEMDSFIKLPYTLYKDYSAWPGQDDNEVRSYFGSDQNPYASYIILQPFLAIRDGEIVGRICGIVNDHYNKHWGTQIGFFGFFESINDQDVANELLTSVANWVKEHGMEGFIGPMSPTYLEEVGILLDSFDRMPPKGMPYTLPYYPELLNNYGLVKERDILHPIAKAEKIYEMIEKKMDKIQNFLDDGNIFVRYFDRNNFERDSEIVRDLLCQTFHDHWGYYPAEEKEWNMILKDYMERVHEDLFLIIEDGGMPIAFTLAFRDDNQVLKARQEGKENCTITRQKWDIVGIRSDYHRNGLGTFMVYNLLPGLQAHGTDEFCGSWVLEDNFSSLGLCRSLGLEFNTTYRVYRKMFE